MQTVIERLLTSGEAAEEIGISRASLQRWARDGKVRPALTTPGGQYRWRLHDLRQQLGMPPASSPQ
jgi:predicted site-specific integrase-resolvase